MIFLCHGDVDKPVVEPIALRLRGAFGEDRVFYDAWSIDYGDGIIDRMNAGLEEAAFLFFFVTEASLNSGMCQLEWQNALVQHARGKLKVIPVRVGDVEMPAILAQTRYLDLRTLGVAKTAEVIERIARGERTYEPQHLDRANLVYRARVAGEAMEVEIEALLVAESNPDFLFVLDNAEGEVAMRPTGAFMAVEIPLGSDSRTGWLAQPLGGIEQGQPLNFILEPTGSAPVRLIEVARKAEGTKYRPLQRAP